MNLLVFSLLLVPLLLGVLCLFLGGRRMRLYRWEVERDPTRVSILFMLFGSLLVGVFVFPVLLVASGSLVIAAGVVTAQSFLLIFWGEKNLRDALVFNRSSRGAPWVIFWGVVPLVIYPSIWMGFSELLGYLYITAMLLILPTGQYLLIKHWKKLWLSA